MIGRRTAVGLSLLCALIFSAIAVQSAWAAKATNTTAVTCVEGQGDLDFEDPHCNNKVTSGHGTYGHVEIKPDPNNTTEITFDNNTTGEATSPAVLKSKAFGAAVEISCSKVHGEGLLHNVEDAGPPVKHTVTTRKIRAAYSGCTVLKPAKCVVSEPIEIKGEGEGVEGLGPESNTMGLELKGEESATLAEIAFKNKGAEACALNGKSLALTGSAITTGTPSPNSQHSGVTKIFTDAMTTETLQLGGVAAGLDSTTTVRMKNGAPIAFTTNT